MNMKLKPFILISAIACIGSFLPLSSAFACLSGIYNCNDKVPLNDTENAVANYTGMPFNVNNESPQGVIIFADDFGTILDGNSIEKVGSGNPWLGDEWFPSIHYAYQAGGAVRLGTAKQGGSITSKKIPFEGGTIIVEISVKGWETVESDLIITVGGQTKTAAYTSTMSDEWEIIKIKFDSVVANPTISLSSSVGKRCFIDSVVLIEADETSESELIPVTKISFSDQSYILNKGEKVNFSLDIEPSNATNKSVSFSSSDTCVAYVAGNIIYAKSEGSAIITATAKDGSNISGRCSVTVKDVVITEDIPDNVILYEASAKLTGTTSTYYPGLHYNAFNANIQSHTFSNGKGEIKFDGNVTCIGHSAFYGCTSLTSITIPNSVESIGGFAFYGCSGLTSITIPNSVESIGGTAFDACSGLTSITIPNSVTSIGSGTFAECI